VHFYLKQKDTFYTNKQVFKVKVEHARNFDLNKLGGYVDAEKRSK